MASPPTYKIELEFDNPNVQSEVPEVQPIRTPQATTDNETGYEITDLSPPILTVTKKETTLTKGDLKFQNVTVTDDVSPYDHDHEDQSNDEMTTPRNSKASISYDSDNDSGRSEKEGKLERKSKIPMLRLRQAIQKVQEEQKEKKTREGLRKPPRRSSIPRLNIKNPKIEVTTLKPEDEFEKLYNETVDNDNKGVLTAKIDDSDKIDSKFEDIIHAYDETPSSDRSVHKEVSRLSRIPALRRRDDGKTKLGGLTERVKAKTPDTEIKDGGFRVSDSKIKIKRFSRGNSRDLDTNVPVDTKKPDDVNKKVQDPIQIVPIKPKRSKINVKTTKEDGKLDVTEKYEEIMDGNTKLTKNTIITEEVKQMPIRKFIRSTTETGPDGAVEIIEKVEIIPSRVITNETIIEENGVPTKKERVVLDVSGEKQTIEIKRLNNDNTSDIYIDNNPKVIENIAILEDITLEPVIITENIATEFNTEDSNTKETPTKVEENESNNVKNKPKIVNIKIVKPVFPKSNNSNIIGSVKTLELSKTFERKQGPNIKSTTYTRSYSENPKSVKNNYKNDSKLEETDIPKTKVYKIDDFELKKDDFNQPRVIEDNVPKRPIFHKSYSVGIEKASKIPFNIHERYEEKYKQAFNDNSVETIDVIPPNIENQIIIDQNEEVLSPNVDIEQQEEEINKGAELVEGLPKKQSVLSKIAIFEGLKAPKNHIDKKLPKLVIHKDNTETKPEYTENDTIFESIGYINHDDSTYDTVFNDQVNYTPHNTPIIVKEIWKTGENLSAINPVIIEKHLDSKIQGYNEKDDIIRTNNGKLDKKLSHDEEKIHKIEIKNEPEVKYRKTSIGKKVSHPDRYSMEMPTIIPSNIDVINELRAVSPKLMPIRIDRDDLINTYNNAQSNIGNSQEHTNKDISIVEAVNYVPKTIEYEEVKEIEPDTVTVNQQKELEITSEAKKKRPGKIDFSAWQHKVESNKPKVKKTEFRIEKLQSKYEIKENTDERRDLKSFERVIDINSLNRSNVNNKHDYNEQNVDSNNTEHHSDVIIDTENNNNNKIPVTEELLQDDTDFQQNESEPNESAYDEAINTHFDGLDKYLSENDEFDYENDKTANSLENESNSDQPKDYIKNEPSNKFATKSNADENSLYSYDVKETNGLNKNYDTSIESNENEFDDDRHKDGNSTELGNDMRRAQSLAELDLGDAVKGKVQRMLGRIKSVDLENKVEKGNRRISVREMPKKMTVFEKIALFEGRTTPHHETTFSKPEPSKFTPEVPEEVYLQKIEELVSGKIRLGKFEDMLYWKLSNDQEIPVIALGTALMDKRLIPYIIGAAIDMGYRAFDCAYIYGNERIVGKAINDKINDGTVQREDLFIISKLWSTFHNPGLVETACRQSLDTMGLDYFDLYLIHNPMSFKEGPDPIPKISGVLQYSEHSYIDAWFGMEALIQNGLVKSIGVSNFNSEQIKKILTKGRIRPVVNQVECHPYLAQQRLNTFCTQHNITLSCFGTLGSKGTPEEYKSGVSPVIDDPLVKTMALGLGVTPAQLLIRYQIENGRNVVVKCSTATHLWDNLQALSFTLEPGQIAALTALNRNKRIFTFKGMGDTHKNYPFKAPF